MNDRLAKNISVTSRHNNTHQRDTKNTNKLARLSAAESHRGGEEGEADGTKQRAAPPGGPRQHTGAAEEPQEGGEGVGTETQRESARVCVCVKERNLNGDNERTLN